MAVEHVIRVYDRVLNFLAECSDFTAAVCVWKWNTYGTFEFHFDKRLPWMEKDNLIIWDYNPYKNGIIKYINQNEEGVILRGFTLFWLLTDRITLPPVGEDYDVLGDTPEDVLYKAVDHNAVNPVDPKRVIPLLSCEKSRGRGGEYKYQTRHDELASMLTEVSRASFLGVGIRIDFQMKKLVFEVMEGTDRSTQQKENPRVIFADFYGNLSDREYTLNDTETKNCAYVAGQGEGAARTIVVVNDSLSGHERRETFVDARDLEEGIDLPSRGETKLADMRCAENYEAGVDTSAYGKRWYLGDLVTVVDEEFGVSMVKQVMEVEEDLDENGYSVIPTFGIPEKSIQEKARSGSSGGSGGGTSGGISTYIHTQMTAAAQWMIPHNLGRFPSVTVADSAGSVVLGETEYLDRNTVRLTFSSAFAGHAYLN